MQKILSRLCAVSSAGAGVGLVAIVAIIIAQILARLLGKALPSTDDFAAWSMAATVFLALPGAFFNGSHIRVTLGVDRIPTALRHRVIQLGNLVALAVLAAGTWFIAVYVKESFIYNDMSQGAFPVPLWMPQVFMLAGMVLCLPVLIWLGITGADQVLKSDDEVPHDA